jgi:hypothetical protein
MERVLQNTAPTISATFYVDGVGTNPTPDTATVEITTADGTVLVPSTAATNDANGKFTYQLTTTHTALLDSLTVEWTSNFGTVVTHVEVAGGFLFSTADALGDTEINDPQSVTTAAEIASARTMAEQAFENVCGVAFVPRYALETGLNGDGSYRLPLRWPHIRAFRSGTVDDTALTVGEVGAVVPQSTGVYNPSGWTSGYGNVAVGYEHGYDYPPPEVSRAVLRLAKHYLTDWSADDRALRLDTDAGSYVMAVPGRGGSDFGIPEVDAVAQRYSHYVPLG